MATERKARKVPTRRAAADAGLSPPGPVPAGSVGSEQHAEWLLDEALAETFPASDPISPAAAPEPAKPESKRAARRKPPADR